MSLYSDVWIETVRSTAWPVRAEITSYAMYFFGGYDMWLVTMLCVLGAVFGGLLTWYVGHRGYRFFSRYASPAAQARFANVQKPFHKYGYLFALFIWLPSGFSIGLALGFFNIRCRSMLMLAAIGSAAFYGAQFLLPPLR